MLQGSTIHRQTERHHFEAIRRRPLSRGLAVKPTFDPWTHGLDLQGMTLAGQPGTALQAQQLLLSNLRIESCLQLAALEGTLQLNHR